MGLGKSLTCISLLHALMNHPSLISSVSSSDDTGHGLVRPKNRRLIRTALLVVPTNVLSHWEEEWDNWTGDLVPSVTVYNLAVVGKESRPKTVRSWMQRGGVLLVSNSLFVQLVKSEFFQKVRYDWRALKDIAATVSLNENACFLLEGSPRSWSRHCRCRRSSLDAYKYYKQDIQRSSRHQDHQKNRSHRLSNSEQSL